MKKLRGYSLPSSVMLPNLLPISTQPTQPSPALSQVFINFKFSHNFQVQSQFLLILYSFIVESTSSLLNSLLPSNKAHIIPFRYRLLSWQRAFCSSNASCIPTKAFPTSSNTSSFPSDSGSNSTSTLDLFCDCDPLVPALGFRLDTSSELMVQIDLQVKHQTHEVHR